MFYNAHTIESYSLQIMDLENEYQKNIDSFPNINAI